jgi:hypothetical protein
MQRQYPNIVQNVLIFKYVCGTKRQLTYIFHEKKKYIYILHTTYLLHYCYYGMILFL